MVYNQEIKRDGGKPEPSLVPWASIKAMARVRRYGIDKYGAAESWRDVEPHRWIDAALRHIYAHLNGEIIDPESGLPHLWHASTSLGLCIASLEQELMAAMAGQEQIRDIDTLITRLRDIAWDFPPEHSINKAADMLTVLQAENNKLQDELRRRDAEIARLNEAREIANEKAREYESRAEMVKEQETIINNVCRNLNEFKTSHNKLLKMCQELGNFDRLRELVEADKEGRLIILPVREGESLWIYDRAGKPQEMVLVAPDIRCRCKDDDLYCELACSQEKRKYCLMHLPSELSYLNKTVFLTREAAEAALKEREQNE